jgi:hypothetical protein
MLRKERSANHRVLLSRSGKQRRKSGALFIEMTTLIHDLMGSGSPVIEGFKWVTTL